MTKLNFDKGINRFSRWLLAALNLSLNLVKQ